MLPPFFHFHTCLVFIPTTTGPYPLRPATSTIRVLTTFLMQLYASILPAPAQRPISLSHTLSCHHSDIIPRIAFLSWKASFVLLCSKTWRLVIPWLVYTLGPTRYRPPACTAISTTLSVGVAPLSYNTKLVCYSLISSSVLEMSKHFR
jgi:hypothetical protein